MKKFFNIIIFLFTTSILFSQLPYSESFETDLGIWTQLSAPADDFDWTRQSGPTPTQGTGPNAASDGSYYLFIEANGHNDPPKTAIIEATFDFSSATMPIFSFDYHMFGDGMGNLRLYIYDNALSSWVEVWNQFNNQGNQWHNVKLCLGDYAGLSAVKMRFKAETQYSDSSDIAIDNLQINDFYFVNTSHTDVSCGGYSDATIDVTVGGGFGSYEFSRNDGVDYVADANSHHQFTGLSGGDYPIRAKDVASGCIIRGPVESIDEPETPDITYTKVDVSPCIDSKNGQITISATGNYSPFTYSIHGFAGPFQSSDTFTGLDTGQYQIAVKNTNDCIALGDKVSINCPYEIKILDISADDVSTCYGDCNGSVTVTVGGGNSPLSYSIDEGAHFGNEYYFPDLCIGNYRVIIEDSQGCRDTTNYVTINQPTQVVINNVTHTDVTGCFGDSTGTITVDASGGTGEMHYSIDNGFVYQDTGFFSNLPANSYHIKVRDANNCSADGGSITIVQPTKVEIDSVTYSDVDGCYGSANGEIHIFAHGGTAPMNYSIDNGSNFQASNDFLNLDVGTYYPYVKDAHNCRDSAESITLTQPQPLVITNVNVYDVSDCYGASTGRIQIFAGQGTPPYRYSVDGGTTYQSNYTFDNLPAGEYYIAVKDTNDCEVLGDTVSINQPTQIVITDEIANDVSCYNANDGSIFVDANGGTGDLLYSVDNGISFPYVIGTITYHDAGSYQIAVRDENGCVVHGSTLTINQPDSLVIDSVIVQDVAGCYGDSSGVITVYASGGTSPFYYSIDNGLTYRTINVFDSLPAKTGYLPFVKDVNGCFVTGNPQTIGQPAQLIITSQSHTDIDTCHGTPVGTITINTSGGSGTIYYSIDNGTNYYANGGHFTNLYAGTYNTAVKDEHNCPANGWAEIIHEPDTLILDSIDVQNVNCSGQGNGHIYIYATGGQPQLRYSIDNGLTFNYSNQFNNLQPGNYDIIVKDAYNCATNSTASITQPDSLFLDSVIYTNVETCYGDSSATITVYAHGGTPDIEYSYTNLMTGSVPYQINNFFDNISAGSYYVSIKDGNGCTETSTAFTITQPTSVQISNYQVQDISCHGLTDGQISIYATGGAGKYYYSIDNGVNWSLDSNFTGLLAGIYTLLAKDTNNCVVKYPVTVEIVEPTQVQIYDIQTTNPTCFGYEDGKIKIFATGGNSPYTYILLDTISQNTSEFDSLSQGEYWVTVIDDNNCVAHGDTVTLTMPENRALFTTDIDTGCSPLTVDFSPNNTNGAFVWSFGDGDSSYFTQPTHIYFNRTGETQTFNVNVMANHGICHDTASTMITVYSQPNLNFSVDTTIHYFPDTTVYITNLATEYENYFWDFGDSTSFSGINPNAHSYPNCGYYDIKLTANNEYQCLDTQIVTVMITSVVPSAGFVMDHNDGCSPLTINFTNTSSNAISYEWAIDAGNVFETDTNITYTFTEAQNHLITLTAHGYCNTSDTAVNMIYVYPVPEIDFVVEPDTVGLGQMVRFISYTTNANYITWFFGDGVMSFEENTTHEYDSAGLYDITLKAVSANGCIDSLTLEDAVFVSDKFFIDFPTAFTPNGDGKNDLLVPVYNLVRKCRVEIYSRGGQLVFRTDDFENTFWDGTFNGHKQPVDVYILRYAGQYDSGKYFEGVKEITLIR